MPSGRGGGEEGVLPPKEEPGGGDIAGTKHHPMGTGKCEKGLGKGQRAGAGVVLPPESCERGSSERPTGLGEMDGRLPAGKQAARRKNWVGGLYSSPFLCL